MPDPYRGETIKAYVSLKAGAQATADEIKAFARERMAAYKYPRVVEIIDEIPKNASGKVLRRVFQESAAAATVPDVRYEDLRAAVEARAVLELGVVSMLAGGAQVRAGRAVGLYQRLETMLAQVRADGHYVDRGAFLDANQAYHQYLIDLADSEPLSDAFRRLGLRELFEKALQASDATSEQAITQHEQLTDAVAAGNAQGAHQAILTWTEASQGRVRLALGVPDKVPATAHRRPGEFGHRQRARRQCRSPFPSPGSGCARRGPRRPGRPGDRGPAVDRRQTAPKPTVSCCPRGCWSGHRCCAATTPRMSIGTCGRRRLPPGIHRNPGQPRGAGDLYRVRHSPAHAGDRHHRAAGGSCRDGRPHRAARRPCDAGDTEAACRAIADQSRRRPGPSCSAPATSGGPQVTA